MPKQNITKQNKLKQKQNNKTVAYFSQNYRLK